MGDKDNGPAGPTVHRTGRSVPERQDDAARSDSFPHGRDCAAGHGRSRNHRRRRQQRGAPPQNERRGHGCDHDLHGRQLHLHRLPRFGGIRPRHACRAAGGRCRRGGVRGGRPQGRAAAAHFARTRRSENPALSVPQQDRQDRQAGPRKPASLLQPASRVPLLLRQIPIWKNDIVNGFVDLALERAFVYSEHAPSEVIALDGEALDPRRTRASPCWRRSPTTTTS